MNIAFALSAYQWRGVWGEVQSSLGTGRGYCANLGHPEEKMRSGVKRILAGALLLIAGSYLMSLGADAADLLGDIFDMAFQFFDMPSFHRRR